MGALVEDRRAARRTQPGVGAVCGHTQTETQKPGPQRLSHSLGRCVLRAVSRLLGGVVGSLSPQMYPETR